MEKFLIDFLEHPQNRMLGITGKPGPVVTISRECGCSSNRIAIKLSKILTGFSYHSKSKKEIKWKWVNKEIIEKVASELDLDHNKIKNVFLKEARKSLHEVSTAFSTEKVYDADDQEVIDTVKDVIRQLAINGHCVIVGRAANIVTKDIPDRLSIKLQAPLKWRINRIRETSSMTFDEAEHYVTEIDKQRNLFVEHMAGRKLDNNDFDVVFNYSTLTDDQIVDAIINLLKNKSIIV